MAEINYGLVYRRQGRKYGGAYALGKTHTQKGIVLFPGHASKRKEDGHRPGVGESLRNLIEDLPDHHPTWAVAGIDPGQQFDLVSETTQKAVAAGVRAFMEECKLQENQIFLWGHSEGGILAALLAAKHLPDVGGVIIYNGITDFSRFMKSLSETAREKQERGLRKIGFSPAEYDLRSPITYAAQFRCPVFVWYGLEDKNPKTNPKYSIAFAEILERMGKKVVILPFEGDHHPKIFEGEMVYPHRPEELNPGFGYQYDRMWEKYFVPFIENPEAFIAAHRA